jgi:polysaccharide biosynthesis protein VpsQ
VIFAFLFTLFIVGVIILADMNSLPPIIHGLYRFPYGDKVGHFILFGLLTFFITRAFLATQPTRPRGWVAVSIGLILAPLIGLEEWSQQFFSVRTFDLLDLLASYAGVAAFAFLAVHWKKPPNHKRETP